jgi:hypothetical protein
MVQTFVPMLEGLSHLLDKGLEHAQAKHYDSDVLVNGRLAPDMFPLVKHVQLSCYHALEAVGRLHGEDVAKPELGNESMLELKARIADTVRCLRAVAPESFAGTGTRPVVMPLSPELRFEMRGMELVRDWSLPLFYFHVVTTYAILRHNGVDIGIQDYGRPAAAHLRQVARVA